jgi:hypothetical protein
MRELRCSANSNLSFALRTRWLLFLLPRKFNRTEQIAASVCRLSLSLERGGGSLPFAVNRNRPEGRVQLASRFAGPQTSSFSAGVRGSLTLEHRTPIPAPWERKRVLRPLRLELSTQTIHVQPLQCSGDEALVSADEPHHAADGSALQCAGRAAVAAATARPAALALRVPRVAVVRPQSCLVRLGAYRARVARVGHIDLEGGKAKS